MKKIIILMVVGLLAAAAVAAEISPVPIFQVRLVAEKPSADSEPMVQVTRIGAGTVSNIVNVQKMVVMDQSSIQSARVVADALGEPLIELTFTKEGKKQLAEITGKSVGRQWAIFLDGKLSCAPIIQAPLTRGKAQIAGVFTKDEAKALAKRINLAVKK